MPLEGGKTMKKVIVAFACAAGMLLMLSNVCNNSEGDGISGAGGGQGNKGASQLPRLPFDWACPSGAGIGNAYANAFSWEYCNPYTNFNPPGGACFQVSGEVVIISFDRDSNSDISIQFIVPTEGFTAPKTYDIDAGQAIFRARDTGRREDFYDSELCPMCDSYLNILAINGNPAAWADGDTIDISWFAAGGEVKDGACDGDSQVVSSSGANGGGEDDRVINGGVWAGIPYK
jgi:hypothetical protein